MDQKLSNHLLILNKIVELEHSISLSQQISLVQQIYVNGLEAQEALLELLVKRRNIQKLPFDSLDGILFEKLYNSQSNFIQQSLKSYFPHGLMDFSSSCNIEYKHLQTLLIQKQYQKADHLTQLSLCKLVGLDHNSKRNWLYFTDIPLISSDDLKNIDLLWRLYSREKFGFSSQRQIWLANDCDWEKLWMQIGWKREGIACRYPSEFTWNINAPKGHLPLSNQLRGMQVLSALFNHTFWNE
uniref:Conserved hypothetical plastid protein n=1 Tax=Caulacanthus okamurae TaxID=152008 RepID=A0A6H1U6V8_9FLOR|nr:conserved hypothetical plastid protein [Caulacanthus okamurae]QIZ74581.1 conserved hypothetical plastid protein [Caulacanthus okamurae]